MSPTRISRRSRWLLTMTGLLLFFLSVFPHATASDNPDKNPKAAAYIMVKSVMGAGGSPGGDGAFLGNGTLGQSTPIGRASGRDFSLAAGFWHCWVRQVSDVPDPLQARLYQNYPNPFNPLTTIRYAVAREGLVTAAVFDARGRRLRTLVHEVQTVGSHQVVWDGKDQSGRQVSTGVYFYKLQAGNFTAVRKMVLMK